MITNTIPMVDKLTNVSDKGASTVLFISNTNVFCHNGHIAETGIIEHIVQSVHAMGERNNFREKNLTLKEVQKFTLYFLPKIDETINTSIKVVSKAKETLFIHATTTVDDEIVVTCTMKFIIQGDK